ncbi:hypothetical protein B5V90_02260 [Heyndrickxia sporothermodurans]|nr:hypothetical protein B5V90_02260 [Heyndrickxia sporothermodurans]
MSASFLKALEANYVVGELQFARRHQEALSTLRHGSYMDQEYLIPGITLSQEVISAVGIPSHASAEGASNTLKTGGACAFEESQRSRVVPSVCEDQGSAASECERAQGNVHVGTYVTTGNDCPLYREGVKTTSMVEANAKTQLEGEGTTSSIEKQATGNDCPHGCVVANGQRLPTHSASTEEPSMDLRSMLPLHLYTLLASERMRALQSFT